MATPVALTIAGSDSGGGAGIQADLKTFSALGVYGTSALTAITAQNTVGVTAVALLAPSMVAAQIEAVLSDIPPGAIKIGMLGDVDLIAAVADGLESYTGPIVLDPVMVAKSGDQLLVSDAVAALRERLLPMATILTPNLPEAACLLDGSPAATVEATEAQGKALRSMGPDIVVMKGGHGEGPTCVDLIVGDVGETRQLTSPRIETRNTHGTGCSLSSAIAAGLAKGLAPEEAIMRAQSWLHGAITAADSLDIGEGHGPVHHFHEIWV